MRREDYFISKIEENNLDHIIIKWYEVNPRVIPGSAEGMLIQEYFNKHGELPPWNEGF